MKSCAILIPARYGSTRFPGKPLTMLGNKTMIEHVYERCSKSGLDTFVLTDNQEIYNLIPEGHAIIDDTPYDNGTERCAGAICHPLFSNYNFFINVQGDMPDVTYQLIYCVLMTHNVLGYDVTTACTNLDEVAMDDPNAVKLVRSGNDALWFGRGIKGYGERHLGVYGYTRRALNTYQNLPKCVPEQVEGLEQLRWLIAKIPVGVTWVEFEGVEINTPNDVIDWDKNKA